MKFIEFKLKFKKGEEVTLRKTDSGLSVCPICGRLLKGKAPYGKSFPVIDGKPIGLGSAGASFDICPSCDTQWGNDDFPSMDEPQSRNWKWQQLRRDWLRRIETTDAVKEQLRNLGLDPEKEIDAALRGE